VNPIWVGKFEVSGPRNNAMLEGSAGAFLWIAAQAEDAAKLMTRVEYAMGKLGLNVVDSEQLHDVCNEDELSETVAELISQASRDEESVVCGAWHKFKNHDA
jgi:hypothetical protein